MKRIGIFSGTFDPMHIGHIECCLVTKGAMELDEVLVMIEKKPHRKKDIADYSHRRKMVELSLEEYASINFFDVKKDNVTFASTTKLLEKSYPDSLLVMIVGSDMLKYLPEWDGFEKWASKHAFAVILRSNTEKEAVEREIAKLQENNETLLVELLPAVWSPISSSIVKDEIQKAGSSDKVPRGALTYIKKHKLYCK